MAPKAGETSVEKMEVDEVKQEPQVVEPVKDVNAIAVENIKEQLVALDKGEEHLISRVLQVLPKTRKQINDIVLHKLITSHVSSDAQFADSLLKYVNYSPPAVDTEVQPMDTSAPKTKSPKKAVKPVYSLPESDCYLRLLVLLHLYAQKKHSEALALGELQLISINNTDKRTLDGFAAKTLYFLCVIYEREGRLFDLQGFLNSRLRTATLRHFTESQAVLICWLLRCYLINRQYQSAAHLVSKVAFPENASNNDLARYMYYQGRIKALQLDYNSAAGYFLQAQRKAPQEGAIGFKQAVQKWVVVIGLLQGEIPDRSVFRQPIYRKCLAHYLDLSRGVRDGDVARFNHNLEQHKAEFEADDTLTLIVRLRQNVIKTAILKLRHSRGSTVKLSILSVVTFGELDGNCSGDQKNVLDKQNQKKLPEVA
ncbi:unnamed protein product [Caenorhabditis brenneri]